ncbi:alpha/beta fold hydrolase [Duganella vulcania]|uniref:Alpha/beta fold hydrolase n=1 Tax=Duganella vulcania TaxID=2692166 RepID=A0A845GTA0_9BURK|nr:alpha/beta hydrolase [Duganella vulcania]MYM96650.1 alpha/beta fold hydrolase [Duganella vulcania]
MLLTVQGVDAYCYTGGKPFNAALPTVVFIHGAQNDHSVWVLQTRYFAHHGYSVLAVDLPGHGRSKGAAKASVPELADWLLQVLDAAGVQKAALFGHSMGSLIALEASHRAPERVTHLGMIGSTYPMKVSDALLETSRSDEQSAIDMVNIWSHSSIAQKPSCPGPGFSIMGGSRRLMQRISQINPQQVFHTDFSACNAYANGEAAAQAVRCPTLFLFGARDMMTPPKSTKLLTSTISHGKVVTVDSGHSLMSEQPDAVLDALFSFAGT